MTQLTLTLKMTTTQVVETSVTVNSNSPIQDYVHPDDQTQPFEMTPGFKPFTKLFMLKIKQVAKKIIFTACHSGKLKLASTSAEVISTSPRRFLTSIIEFIVLLLFELLKKHHLLGGASEQQNFTSPIAKSTILGLHCHAMKNKNASHSVQKD